MRCRVVVSIALSQSKPQGVFYSVVGRGDCERVLKQSEAVSPAMNLRISKSSKSQQNPLAIAALSHGATRRVSAISANPNTIAMNKPIDGI